MRSVNKVTLIGNVGQAPEVRQTQSGQSVANFTMATNEAWGKGDARQERTEWHRIVAWGNLAEIAEKYVTKGSPLYVEGRIETRKWEDKNGETQYTKEIVLRELVFLGGGDKTSPVKPVERTPDEQGVDDYFTDGQGGGGDDLPF